MTEQKDINEFGQHSFVNWTTGLVERIEMMSEPEYLCLSDDSIFTKDELHQCPKCNEYSCPDCGGEVQTIEEYEENMRLNNE